ncbi:hypothetical protein [Thermomonospora umbrina]|uniref:Ig-like domain-containing protein n=1 Tax=Thermomonospora umbrina TaxID=111806 RepID=A0A3D9T721_9ACTN|nr:hypothetical protein [Thermomonospora umbrina]REF01056.1 hypothetical protein DFJ69_6655 [Thermomonospora umbrina]
MPDTLISRRGPAALLTGLALVCALAPGMSRPAHARADAPLTVCPGHVEQSISPGLTVLPRKQEVTVLGRFVPCAGRLLDPQHAAADFTASATGLLSCSLNVPITNAGGTVRWRDREGNDSGTSEFTGGMTLSQRPLGENVGIVLATIDSGEFAGRTLMLISARLTIEPHRCLTTGIRNVAGPGSLEILPL